MKRKYEVAYYECGLTRRIARRFFFRLTAYLYWGWLKYKLGNPAEVEVIEHD
jgi:hypothetical protein